MQLEKRSSRVHQLLWNEPATVLRKACVYKRADPSSVLENTLVPGMHEESPHGQMACSTSLKLLPH